MWPFARKPAPKFSVPEGVRLYAIGDIHGRADLLRALLEAMQRDAESFDGERIIQVFLGDYIDRGMQSREVIDLLLTPAPDGVERIFLRGNHEQTLLDCLQNPSILRDWMQYGGLPTLASYGVNVPANVAQNAADELQARFAKALPKEHLRFFEGLLSDYTIGDYYCVHAGVRPHVALNKQREQDKLWIREPFLSHSKLFEKYILHGHSPLEKAEILPNRANLDVNNAQQPTLCALRAQGAQRSLITMQL
jgi:serine/threonine protein phosphatase 1